MTSTKGSVMPKNWKLIVGGFVVAFLVILLLIARGDARHFHRLYDAAESARQLEIAKHAITRQSLGTCIGSINDMNVAVEKLKADGDARQAAAVKASEDARKAAESAETRARALEASAAGSRPGGACRGSAAYETARSGL